MNNISILNNTYNLQIKNLKNPTIPDLQNSDINVDDYKLSAYKDIPCYMRGVSFKKLPKNVTEMLNSKIESYKGLEEVHFSFFPDYKDPDLEVRKFAENLLKETDLKSLKKTLLNKIKEVTNIYNENGYVNDADKKVGAYAVELYGSASNHSQYYLLNLLSNSKISQMRESAATVLGKFQNDKVRDIFLDIAENEGEDNSVRTAIINSIADNNWTADAKVKDTLFKIIDRNLELSFPYVDPVKEASIDALAKNYHYSDSGKNTYNEEIKDKLKTTLLDDPYKSIRKRSAQALGKYFNTEDVEDTLLDIYKNEKEDSILRTDMAEILAKNFNSAKIKQAMVNTIENYENNRAKLLKDKDYSYPGIESESLRILGDHYKTDDVMNLLLGIVEKRKIPVQNNLYENIGENADTLVRETAIKTLVKNFSGHKKVEEALTGILEEEENSWISDASKRAVIDASEDIIDKSEEFKKALSVYKETDF